MPLAGAPGQVVEQFRRRCMRLIQRERYEHFLEQSASMFGAIGWPVRKHLAPAVYAIDVLETHRKRGSAAHHAERIADRFFERHPPYEDFDAGQMQCGVGH
jgi:hypothetical protein